MNVTRSSTAADDARLARRLPPDLLKLVLGYEDELERRRASQPDTGHARKSRTAKLEALIDSAIEAKLARLEEQHQRFRISTVLDYLRRSGHHPPTRAVVQRVLRAHGLYEINN